MMEVLTEIIQTCDVFLLTIKSRGFTRIDGAMHTMLHQMTALFGEEVWSKMVINFGYVHIELGI